MINSAERVQASGGTPTGQSLQAMLGKEERRSAKRNRSRKEAGSLVAKDNQGELLYNPQIRRGSTLFGGPPGVAFRCRGGNRQARDAEPQYCPPAAAGSSTAPRSGGG
eukprot:EG_transcript_27109